MLKSANTKSLANDLSYSLVTRFYSTLSVIWQLPIFARQSSAHAHLIGVDFNAHSIYGVALSYQEQATGCDYQLQALAKVSLPSGAIIDHQLHNHLQVFSALKQLRRRLKISTLEVATAVRGHGVLTKVFDVPNDLAPDLMAHHVKQLVAEHLTESADDIYIDYEVLEASDAAASQQRLLLSAAHRAQVKARVALLRQVGWRPQIVDINYHALARAVDFLLAPRQGQSVLVLELSHESLLFMVLLDGQIIYQRLQFLALERELSINTDAVVHHAKRQLQLFMSQSAQALPSLGVLCGTVAGLSQLISPLSTQLDFKLQVLSFAHAFGQDAPSDPASPEFATALGLALRVASYRVAPCRI
ncbi:type IV pilus biogenesis protein PilM [Oceanisphaera avium]|nr:pilus assembly protein PilM [Oceanisphaera avium]